MSDILQADSFGNSPKNVIVNRLCFQHRFHHRCVAISFWIASFCQPALPLKWSLSWHAVTLALAFPSLAVSQRHCSSPLPLAVDSEVKLE